MKIVMQCAGSKSSRAGTLQDSEGRPIKFCSNPERSVGTPRSARPDDATDGGGDSWRSRLEEYNRSFGSTATNPLGLMAAGNLYTPPAYAELRRSGISSYILSAGWGLVRASYLLPDYDVTFSKNSDVPAQNKRSMSQTGWKDFNHLRDEASAGEEIHFFGAKSYLDLFYQLTSANNKGERIVIHHKGQVPKRSGFHYEEFIGAVSTNWHYVALGKFLGSV